MRIKVLQAALVIGALGLVQLAKAQGFNRHYDAYSAHFAQGSYGIENADDGWMVFSFSYEPDTITPDSILGIFVIVLQRLDTEGNVTLEKRIQYPGHSIFLGWADCCDSIIGGGFVIGGGSTSYTDVIEARLMRLNAEGDTLWTRSYGSAGHYWIGQQIKQTSDGGFLICGNTDAVDYENGFAIKTDSLGDEQWRHTYGAIGIQDGFTCIAESDNGYILAGVTFPTADNIDFLVTKIDSLGSEIWTTSFGSPFKEPSPSLLLLADGRLLLGGAWAVDANGYETAYTAFLDPLTGAVTSTHLYGAPEYSRTLFAAKQLPNSDIIHCGVTYDGGAEQGIMLRTTSDGDSLWMRTYFYYDSIVPQGQGRFWDVVPTADNGCIVSGFAGPPFFPPLPPNWSQDAWVVKVDSMGCVVPGCAGLVGITEQVTNLTKALHLYPNPVQDQLHVGIDLPPK
ncbi:MAG: hypothetical protein ACOH13_14255, partial [Flavobacteriales bacterium]